MGYETRWAQPYDWLYKGVAKVRGRGRGKRELILERFGIHLSITLVGSLPTELNLTPQKPL